MSERYYLRDSRSNTGSNMMFWAAGGGYTTDLSRAEEFTRSKAFAQHECRESDIPMPQALVDSHARLVVDMQHLRRERANASGGELCYVQIEHCYDGNDVTWVSQVGRPTTDLSIARIWSAQDALCATMRNDGWRVWPKIFIDDLRRYAAQAIHSKQIIQEAGIVLLNPNPPRKYVTRCAHCGRFLSERQQYDYCPNCGGENRP